MRLDERTTTRERLVGPSSWSSIIFEATSQLSIFLVLQIHQACHDEVNRRYSYMLILILMRDVFRHDNFPKRIGLSGPKMSQY